MRTPDPGHSAAEAKLLADIDSEGVHLVHVPGDDEGPGFTFTVGLFHSFGQAEVIVFGLPPEVAHELLNVLTDECDDGKKFAGGEKHEGLLVDYPVRFVAVPEAVLADYFGMALWAYEGTPFPAVQLVWPDKQGRWPWSEGVREGFRAGQPVLGAVPGR
jgi:hypothetical protein